MSFYFVILFLPLLWLLSGCMADPAISQPSGPLIIAHRGASHDAPENTLASVSLAWEQQADAAEIDIHLTRDGKIVAYHDKVTKRIGNRDIPVADQTLEELKTLDVGAFKGSKWKGEKIPTLEEVLAIVPGEKVLIIEVKCSSAVLPELKRTLKKAGKQAKIIGFDLDTMKAAKKLFPDRTVYWLSDIERDEKTGAWKPQVDALIQKAKAAGVDGLNVSRCEYVDRRFVEKVKSKGLDCLVWTVNKAEEAKRLMAAGVDGITTDRPEWLREKLYPKER